MLVSLRGPVRKTFVLWNGGFFVLKEFKNIDSQLNVLKERGLIIGDYNSAKRYLLTNNYYNIINGYSKYFLENHKYVNNSTFEEISRLYFFDKEIKFNLFRATTEAESHIKSILAHRFAEEYQDKPYAYLDINCYDNSKVLKVGKLISTLSSIINTNKNQKGDNAIKHYVNKYNDVPIWVLIGFLTFGQTSTLIQNLPTRIQNKIAFDLKGFAMENFDMTEQFTPEIMMSFINNIREIRNVCAHNNRLLDFNCRASNKYFNCLHSLHNVNNNDKRTDVYNTVLILQCFLSGTEYAQLHNTFKKRVKTLNNRLDSIEINIILESIGFPNNWHIEVETLQY